MVDLSDKRIAPPGPSVIGKAVVARPNTPLLTTKDGKAERVSSAVFGEEVEIYAQEGEFALVRHMHDHYAGWTKAAHLGAVPAEAFTHWISAPMAFGFSKPDLKSAPQTSLFLGSRLIITEVEGDYHFMQGVGWVAGAQLLPVAEYRMDPAGVALSFLGSPYLWGGRDAFGIDCSGLTQQAFAACGTQLPRDSDMQFAWCGEAIENWSEPGILRRGDLVFWRGHVGIMLDEENLIHANANAMAVAYEPLVEAVDRIATHTEYGRPIGAKRIGFPDASVPHWLAKPSV